jgi:hypothetical protein
MSVDDFDDDPDDRAKLQTIAWSLAKHGSALIRKAALAALTIDRTVDETRDENGNAVPELLELQNAIWAVAGTGNGNAGCDYATPLWVGRQISKIAELVDAATTDPSVLFHPQIQNFLRKLSRTIDAMTSGRSSAWVAEILTVLAPKPQPETTELLDPAVEFEAKESDSDPPGQLVAISPHRTNGPPHGTAAPLEWARSVLLVA